MLILKQLMFVNNGNFIFLILSGIGGLPFGGSPSGYQSNPYGQYGMLSISYYIALFSVSIDPECRSDWICVCYFSQVMMVRDMELNPTIPKHQENMVMIRCFDVPLLFLIIVRVHL